ncbi:MAG TPA: cell division protein FtsA [Candidatus Paceibacterota bacterium]
MKLKIGSQQILGLDIGTSEIKVAIAENRDGKPALISVFKQPSFGLRKGAVVDLAETSSAVAKALFEAKKISRPALKKIYVNVGTHQVKAQLSKGIVAISRSDSEIYQDDVDRVIQLSQSINLSANRIIVHNITREYILDGVPDVSDPIGLGGSRLEVSSVIVDAFAPHIKSVMRAVELAGGQYAGMFLDPIASARAVLSKRQKDLGVLLIDLGFGTTSMAVYEENKLTGTSVFPVGASNVTNDLAVVLKIPVAAAENIKLSYAYAVSEDVNAKESIDLRKFVPDAKGMVSRRFIAEIAETRLAEIFEFVNNELRVLKKAGKLAGGVVLTGGGAKLPGITGLAKNTLKLSAQIGCASTEEWTGDGFTEALEDPEFATVLGLVLAGAEKEGWLGGGKKDPWSLHGLLKYFQP